MSEFRFSVGPWNVHEGADSFGPEVRQSISLEDKLNKFREIGVDAVMFHDDDAVPDINDLSEDQIKSQAEEIRAALDDRGLAAEFVAPRLWMDSRTVDGGFTANSAEDREFALWRTFRTVDIARVLGCGQIVIWLAREGTICYESKDPVLGIDRIVEAVDKVLDYAPDIRIMIEPKPNEPVDRSFIPTIGHVMALASRTKDPDRVGGLLESAHAVLAGIDPAYEMAMALSFGKLWSVHLNDQNGMKFDQDKSFGSENLRQAFNQIKVLIDHRYGVNGEYVGLDVKAMRTQKAEDCYRHIQNSMEMVRMLAEKVKQFDTEFQKKCVAERNYEALDGYVNKLLLGEA
ncbi:MAG: TIM barrel protein [Spirochaetia bacterium]